MLIFAFLAVSYWQKLKPMFLELHQDCYEKHPHPKIAEEIRILVFEMQN